MANTFALKEASGVCTCIAGAFFFFGLFNFTVLANKNTQWAPDKAPVTRVMSAHTQSPEDSRKMLAENLVTLQ